MTRCGISNTNGNRVSHPDDPQKTIGGNSESLSQRRNTGYKREHREEAKTVASLQFWFRINIHLGSIGHTPTDTGQQPRDGYRPTDNNFTGYLTGQSASTAPSVLYPGQSISLLKMNKTTLLNFRHRFLLILCASHAWTTIRYARYLNI